MSEISMKVSDVVYREDLYPRIKPSPETVQKYAEDLDVLPPIEVNHANILIDGWHRWTAHKSKNSETINAVVTQTTSDAHILELSIERNAIHGLQLSQADKQKMARKIYAAAGDKERADKKVILARILSVSEKTIARWLADADKQIREERNEKIHDMWMACYTQEEIAEAVSLPQQTIADATKDFTDFGQLSESGKFYATHAAEFEVPVTNVWTQTKKTPGVDHPGNSEVRWVDNLFYMYTKPLDIVVDPFAGSGSTIDICKKRFRRYWVADQKPIDGRKGEIRKWDVAVDGIPSLGWKDVSLVYLDPPYWWQAKDMYGDDPTNLANMSLQDFNRTLSETINGFAAKMKASARTEPSYISLIIQPTQWNAPDKQFTDHVGDMLRAIKLPVDMRIQAPYSSQQCTPQMVEWAKKSRKVLVISREIIVWRVK